MKLNTIITACLWLQAMIIPVHTFSIPSHISVTRSATRTVVARRISGNSNAPKAPLHSTIDLSGISLSPPSPSISLSFQLARIASIVNRSKQKTVSAFRATVSGSRLAIQQSWWCLPMILFFVPMYAALTGDYARMPEFWPLVDVGFLKSMPLFLAGFLGSNIFYFMSGLYLLNWTPISSSGSSSNNLYEQKRISSNKSRSPMLGALVLSSGLVSTIYHTFQALGYTQLAESLCFMDHGLAITSGLYFFQKCGMPSLKTLSIGIPSIGLLAFPVVEAYPVLHSLWHLASAGTTVSWAFDGVERRNRSLKELKQRRKMKQE